MKSKGLKAYDLVWVEGRSAAWRYPCELEELKPFAPEVLEQPYDRFFKKPSQDTKQSISKEKASSPENHSVKESPAVKMDVEKPRKGIYVTLPAGKQTAILDDKYGVEPRLASGSTNSTISPKTLEETNSSKPETFKDKTTLALASKPISSKSNFTLFYPNASFLNKPAFLMVGAACLLALGIFIGMSLGHKTEGDVLQNSNPVAGILSKTATESSNNASLGIPTHAEEPNDKNTIQSGIVSPEKNIRDKKKTVLPVTMNKKELVKESSKGILLSPTDNNSKSALDSNSNNINSLQSANHREAIHRSEVSEKENTGGGSLVNLISLSTNKYNVGTFGGISDVQLTVTNHSAKALDLVVVEVSYVLANKKIYKTENLYFRNINGGAAVMEEAPKSPRGIKVEYKVSQINPREASLSSTSLR